MTTSTQNSAILTAIISIVAAAMGIDPSQINGVGGLVVIVVAAILAHYNHTTAVQAATTTGTTQSAPVTPTNAIPQMQPDFTVTQNPAFGIAVQQPCNATLIMKIGANAKGLIIDWQDGSAPQVIQTIQASDKSFMATATHVYTLTASELQVGSNKYTGHTFYPLITVTDNNGGSWTYDQAALGGIASPNMGRSVCFEVEQ